MGYPEFRYLFPEFPNLHRENLEYPVSGLSNGIVVVIGVGVVSGAILVSIKKHASYSNKHPKF